MRCDMLYGGGAMGKNVRDQSDVQGKERLDVVSALLLNSKDRYSSAVYHLNRNEEPDMCEGQGL